MSHVYKTPDVRSAGETLPGLNKIKQSGFFTTGLVGTFNEVMCTLHFREKSESHILRTCTTTLDPFYRAPPRTYVPWDTLWEPWAETYAPLLGKMHVIHPFSSVYILDVFIPSLPGNVVYCPLLGFWGQPGRVRTLGSIAVSPLSSVILGRIA